MTKYPMYMTNLLMPLQAILTMMYKDLEPQVFPASWNILDHLDLSSEGSNSDLDEQAAALEKLILADTPVTKLVDYDLSNDDEEADDDDDDDDLFLIWDEA